MTDYRNAQQRGSSANRATFSRAEAASYLSISLRLLDSLAADGAIRRIKIRSRTVFRVRDLDALLEADYADTTSQEGTGAKHNF